MSRPRQALRVAALEAQRQQEINAYLNACSDEELQALAGDLPPAVVASLNALPDAELTRVAEGDASAMRRLTGALGVTLA
jgi:hypothetical protein